MKEELQELHHEAVPGYRKIFFVSIIIGLIYLGIIFLNTL